MDSTCRVKSPVSSSARPSNNKSSRNPNLSPPTARLPAKLRSPNSTPSTPEPSRLRSLTNTAAPAPLHHALSFSSLQPSLKKPSDASPSIRVTSKVSGVVKSGASPTSTTSSQSPSTKPRHVRTGSASSTVTATATATATTTTTTTAIAIAAATSPPPTFYPITTAVPAANPFRYAPSRPPAYKPVTPPGTTFKPDTIVPRPHSPPVSAVSISSRSSVSYSSPVSHKAAAVDGLIIQRDVSSTSSEPSPITSSNAAAPLINGRHERRSSSDSHDYDWGDDDDSDEHKVKAAAKSNRKIADLEITNKSLMAINASLEKTKHKQAKEIRDLRRKLRESRLILPPRAYGAIKSSLVHDDAAAENEDEGGVGDNDDDDDDDDDNDNGESDETFSRLKAMLENLLETGKRALETKVADFGGAGSAAKVLSAEEVWSWRLDSVGGDELEHEDHGPPASPSRVAIRDSYDVGDLDIDDYSVLPSSPPAPPIFITPSP